MTEQEQSDTVAEVIDGRMDVYGDPVDGMIRTAQIWSGILGTEVQPAQVPLMLMGYKLMRTSVCPEYSDNSDDVEGYLDILRKVVGDDMIVARTVAEFLELREQRERKATDQQAFNEAFGLAQAEHSEPAAPEHGCSHEGCHHRGVYIYTPQLGEPHICCSAHPHTVHGGFHTVRMVDA